MGGAVVVHASHSGKLKKLIGTVVLDVVEGTALESLSHMSFFLSSRPASFKSMESAVEWAFGHNQVRNKVSTQLSIPSQLKEDGDSYRWRTNLKQSSSYWPGWFTGLSSKFLAMKGARLLVLAGVSD
jgi:hypothetical protein